MDYRGHPQPRRSHRSKEREASLRQQDYRDYNQPPPVEPRDQDRHWGHSRPEQHHFSHQQHYSYGYGRPEYQRPPSRQDYGHYSPWDYQDNYGYYDYYRGRQDPNQWSQQDSWWTDQYQERAHKLEHPGSNYTEEYRYDRGRDISQQYLSNYEENPPRETEEDSSCHLGTLESSRTSGLSSSSYELSQYMNGAENRDAQPVEHIQVASAPLKFSVPHPVISFGPAGQLIRVNPGQSAQDNLSQLEIHSLEVILSETQEQQDMRKFPGPLSREDLHKVDAMEFAQQMAAECLRDEKLPDRSSASLLWNLLILLCRQNGQIVGSDIAELLMHGANSDGGWESDAPTLIDFDEEMTTDVPPKKGDDLLTGNWSSFTSENSEKALQSYTQLLLAGRKKEALEEAMTSGLWGHALFLASKMDNRSYTTVLNRFTGQLTASDPLQTLFQLLSGRIPAVSVCCGNEKWGDWRPHLAVMLSNETGEAGVQQRAVLTMGDTLASRGLIHAAHVCYLTAGAPFMGFTQKTERLVLLGSSHRQPFEHFATNAAIQCTELYEYCQTLLDKSFSIASFQVFKFLYACRLLDCGLSSQAFHYCEVVGQTLLRLTEPLSVLTGELIKLSDRLRFSEGQFTDVGLSGVDQEPDWLQHLRARHRSFQTGSFDFSESSLPAAEYRAPTHDDRYSVSDVDDLSREIQSPYLELLYHGGNEEPEILTHQSQGPSEGLMPCNAAGAQNWPPASSLPVSSLSPPLPPATAGQPLSYHSPDSGEVRSSASHCPPSSSPSSSMGVQSSSGPAPKTGWFSGWFQSKPKDVPPEGSEHRGPALKTEPSLSTGLQSTAPPPPPTPTISPPNMLPSQPSSTSINPFSRKAGQ